MPLSFTCFYPSLDKGRLRRVVIDAQKECVRAIGPPGVDEALREDRQAVAAALRKRSVGVYDQQRESVLVRERPHQQTVRPIPPGAARFDPFSDVQAATNAFDGASCPTLACPGSLRSSSRKIGEAANLLRRGYKIGIATGIIECGHVHFLMDLRYMDAMISRMTLASENGIFFVMGRPRESCKGSPPESRSSTI